MADQLAGPGLEWALELGMGLMLELELGEEPEIASELVLEPAIIFSHDVRAPVHYLTDPDVAEPETVELHAECWEEWDGGSSLP